MDKKNVKKLRDGFIKAIYDNAEVLLEIIPGVGGTAAKIFRIAKVGLGNYKKTAVEDTLLYMECVAFCCKEGCALSEGQQEMLEAIVLGNYEDDDNENLEIMCNFISKYTEVYAMTPKSEYLDGDIGGINKEAIWLNDQEDDEFPYDGEALEQVMSALNSLLGVPIFNRFDVAGQNESWDLQDWRKK